MCAMSPLSPPPPPPRGPRPHLALVHQRLEVLDQALEHGGVAAQLGLGLLAVGVHVAGAVLEDANVVAVVALHHVLALLQLLLRKRGGVVAGGVVGVVVSGVGWNVVVVGLVSVAVCACRGGGVQKPLSPTAAVGAWEAPCASSKGSPCVCP